MITIATQSQLRLMREIEETKAKTEKDEQTKRMQRARMNALFARLEADERTANPMGYTRPKNPFGGGRKMPKQLLKAGNSTTIDALDNSPIISNIVDWNTDEVRGKDKVI